MREVDVDLATIVENLQQIIDVAELTTADLRQQRHDAVADISAKIPTRSNTVIAGEPLLLTDEIKQWEEVNSQIETIEGVNVMRARMQLTQIKTGRWPSADGGNAILMSLPPFADLVKQ